jgi:hypothetical protein
MSASVEYLSSGFRPSKNGQTERIAEALNPYTSSRNLKLLLDLVANRSVMKKVLFDTSNLEIQFTIIIIISK